MSITPPRRRPLLCAGILTTLVALVLPGLAPAATTRTSTRPAATHHSTSKKNKRKRKRTPPKPLTNAQIIALIKKNEKPGPPGAQGPGGPAGANGAAAGYAAIGSGSPLSSTPTTVVSKALPAGDFVITAKAVLSGISTVGDQVAVGACDLLSSSSATKLDSAQWDQPLGQLIVTPSLYAATTTLPTQAALGLTNPATVSLQCYSSGPSVGLSASFASLQAVQVATGG